MLKVHNLYMTDEYISDYQSKLFLRLRLMLQSQKRWSCTPTKDRVGLCDGVQVQTEQHVGGASAGCSPVTNIQ